MADILAEAKQGAKKTRIMYRCNMSYSQLRTYLSLLEKKGLIRNGSEIFQTTDKGKEFTKQVRNLQTFFGRLDFFTSKDQ